MDNSLSVLHYFRFSVCFLMGPDSLCVSDRYRSQRRSASFIVIGIGQGWVIPVLEGRCVCRFLFPPITQAN